MKENYVNYLDRIDRMVNDNLGFPSQGKNLNTPYDLRMKVTSNGRIKDFYGDCIAFPLSYATKQSIASIQRSLYESCPTMFSQPLSMNSFQIYTQVLYSSETRSEAKSMIFQHVNKIFDVLQKMRRQGKVKLKAKALYNLYSSSIVLLFNPVSEADQNALQEVFNIGLKMNEYANTYTCYCTIAYLCPGTYSSEEWNELLNVLRTLNEQIDIDIALDCSCLEYQYFDSVDKYFTIYCKRQMSGSE